MIFDTHVHIDSKPVYQADYLRGMDIAGVDRTAMFSEEPDRGALSGSALARFNAARLGKLLQWTKGTDRLVPVHYVNVIEADAVAQVDAALDAGVAGFKVICSNHYPDDPRAMPVYEHIARAGKPILFHSGILWDWGANASYNRPGNFECMLLVPGLRFALAHISWPWCDELVAVYGKFIAMRYSPQFTGQQLYIDLTPGTPDIYRRDALRKLLTVGYDDMESRMLFGSDGFTDGQLPEIGQMVRSDKAIYDELNVPEDVQQGFFYRNAMTFWKLG